MFVFIQVSHKPQRFCFFSSFLLQSLGRHLIKPLYIQADKSSLLFGANFRVIAGENSFCYFSLSLLLDKLLLLSLYRFLAGQSL